MWTKKEKNRVLIPSVRSMNYILVFPRQGHGSFLVLIPSVRTMNYMREPLRCLRNMRKSFNPFSQVNELHMT